MRARCAIDRRSLQARSDSQTTDCGIPQQVRKGWQLFASHHDKAAPWLVPSVIASQPETYEDFVEHFMRTRDPILLDSLKQLSIYLGCYGACHWAAPIEVI